MLSSGACCSGNALLSQRLLLWFAPISSTALARKDCFHISSYQQVHICCIQCVHAVYTEQSYAHWSVQHIKQPMLPVSVCPHLHPLMPVQKALCCCTQDGVSDQVRQTSRHQRGGHPEELQASPGEGRAQDPVQDGYQPAVLLSWRTDF